MMSKAIMQQALDALENSLDDSRDRLGNYIATYGENSTYRPHRIVALRKTVSDGEAAIEALRTELAKPESEPVAWMLGHRLYSSLSDAEFDWRHDSAFDNTGYVPVPLYTKDQL